MVKISRRWFSAKFWGVSLLAGPLRGAFPALKRGSNWTKRQQSILCRMEQTIGPFPKKKTQPPLDMSTLGNHDTETVSRVKISYLSEECDCTPGYLPKRLKGRLPGILCLHQTIPPGAAEPAGLGGNPNDHYAPDLAGRGYVSLAPDYPDLLFTAGFGGYRYDFYQHGYKSQTMKGVWNHVRAVNLLHSMPEVDSERIACIGHSLGGRNTLFAGDFDRHIRVLVSSCGSTSFKYDRWGTIVPLCVWSQDRYMPLIAVQHHNNPAEMPFDFSDALAALAPRPSFRNAPLHDANFSVAGVRDTTKIVRPLYSKRFNFDDRLVVRHPDAAHSFPTVVRNEAYQFIDKWLRDERAPRQRRVGVEDSY